MILFSFNYDVPWWVPSQLLCIDKTDNGFLLQVKSHVEIYPIDYKKDYINKSEYEYEDGIDEEPTGVLNVDYEFPEEINGHKFSHWEVDDWEEDFRDDEWLHVFSKELEPTRTPTDEIKIPKLSIINTTSDDEIVSFLNQWDQKKRKQGVHRLITEEFSIDEVLFKIREFISTDD